jgi:hypothetical protein
MSPLKSLLLSSVVLLSSLSLAQVRGEVVIQTRDGKAHLGRVVTETSKGYLLATATGTQVIEFGDIADIRHLAPAAQAAPTVVPLVTAPVPVTPVAAKPVPSAPGEWSAVPPAPPERPADSAGEAVASRAVERPRARSGVRFGLGAGLGTNYLQGLGSVSAALQAMLEVGSGRAAYRLVANAELAVPVGGLLALDNLFVFSFSDLYAVGVGAQVGAAFTGRTFFQLSPVVQPAILKFGDRRQHQVQLTLALTVLSSIQSYELHSKSLGSYTLEYSYLGSLRAHLGYTYVF